jgi:hypothetical protein
MKKGPVIHERFLMQAIYGQFISRFCSVLYVMCLLLLQMVQCAVSVLNTSNTTSLTVCTTQLLLLLQPLSFDSRAVGAKLRSSKRA